MPKKTSLVILFEDTPDDRARFEQELNKVFKPRKVEICAFTGSAPLPPPKDKIPYEVRLLQDLKTRIASIDFIVCDQDLSGIDHYVGLSETVVSAVADDYGLPMALYARGKKPAGKQMLARLKVRKPWTERKIVLDLDGREFSGLASDCAHFYDGFRQIASALAKQKLTKGQSLARTMSEILAEPDLVNTLALYSSGDQQYLQNVMPDMRDRKRALRQASTAMGYWLWESILRFPGIVLNEIAAASFLNIDPKSFSTDEDIVKMFKGARYSGPFGAAKAFWWRHKVQDIVTKANVEDGLALVKKIHPKKHVSGCFCSVEPKLRAGYYCMVTEKPVSEIHSRGKIAWFPAGADLARIERSTFDKHAPWLGLY